MKPKHLVLIWLLTWWILILLVGMKTKNIWEEKPKEEEKSTINIQNETNQTQNSGWSLFEISKEKKTKSIQDLDILKKIYEKTKSNDVLKQIIEKEAQNYQFNDALENIKKLTNQENDINIKLYVYILINSSIIKIWDNASFNQFMQLIEKYTKENKLSNDDYLFYMGLKQIWNTNYEEALKVRKDITSPEYKTTIKAFKEVIASHKEEKSIPTEYRDGLVGLTALKNGYFNIARKIALEALNKNDKYILPYQILAYSHFLSNNWDVAIQYFLRLSEFDNQNKDIYNFLIGSAYYRDWDYSSSVIYLSQVKNANKTDTLRYLIQNYIQLKTPQKTKEIWKLLMTQKDLSPGDFSLYFYTIFYKSYFNMNIEEIERYKDISTTILQNCKERFDNDVCIYWEFGKASLENTIQENEEKYMNLTKEYNVSYLYHIRWDYFTRRNEINKAKEAYARAINLSNDSEEQKIVKEKMNNL